MRSIPELQPNEDAQSLVFDTRTCSRGANIRATTASRAARGSITVFSTPTISPMAATPTCRPASRSSSPARTRTPSPTPPTPASNSGLDKQFSNFVASETLQPFAFPITIGTKQQINSVDLLDGALDGLVTAKIGESSARSTTPATPRSRCSASSIPVRASRLTPTTKLRSGASQSSGGLNIDMSRHYYDVPARTRLPSSTGYHFKVSNTTTTCTSFTNWSTLSSVNDPLATESGVAPPVVRDQTFLFTITFGRWAMS